MDTCIFCKIINKEIPSSIIYEDDICIAFLDISQTTYGHTLVIPKKHYQNFIEVDSDTLAHMTKVTQLLTKDVVDKVGAKGANILTNINEEAGQTVMHFHMHIIPRFGNDALTIEFLKNENAPKLEEVYNCIK